MSSASGPMVIQHLTSPAGEYFIVETAVLLGAFAISKNTASDISSDATSESEYSTDNVQPTPYDAYMLTIGGKKFVALIDTRLEQCCWLKSLSEMRSFMQAHNFARKYHIEAPSPELYADGAKNNEKWTCRYLVGGKYFMGLGLTKQDAKDEAGVRVLVEYKVDFRNLA